MTDDVARGVPSPELQEKLKPVLHLVTSALPDGWTATIVPPDDDRNAAADNAIVEPLHCGAGNVASLLVVTPPDGKRALNEQVASVIGLAVRAACAVLADMSSRPVDPLAITAEDVRRGLDNDEFHVAYQPVVELRNGATIGYEALARWTRADGTNITPDRFIPIAEVSGLIDPLTERVLERMRQEEPAWGDGRGLSCSFNLSAVQLESPERIRRTASLIDASGLSPDRIVVEITESTISQSADLAVEFLARLRADGMRVAIDDFGTAYSSLQRLHELPFDHLKIDRSFVAELGSAHGTSMVRSIIGLAQGLGADVVAEGIERIDQATNLSAWRCRYGQGWHFGRPVPAATLLAARESN